MVEKKSPVSEWSDPKDFGLPFVSLDPLESNEKKVSKKTPIVSVPAKEEKPKEDVISPEELKIKEDLKLREPVKQEKSITSESKVTGRKPVEEEKKSNGWIGAVAVITVVLVAFIIWQNESFQSKDSEPGDELLTTNIVPREGAGSRSEVVQGNTSINSFDDKLQDAEVEWVVESPETTTVPTEEIEENGTTIDLNQAGELIRIETKPERAQYFIVVGSLPNERFALNESDKYWDRANELYLILPNEDSKNHRLAIGRFSDFTAANNELQRVKDQYTEALWILKY